jgi:hypothetical protein
MRCAPQHSVNLGALKFKEAVEARTNGKVQVGVLPSGQLGESTAVGEQISLWGALIGQLSTGVLYESENMPCSSWLSSMSNDRISPELITNAS